MRAGPLNLITDVPGIRVGNAEDHRIRTGVTVVTADAPMVGSVHVMGGAPGTRETDLLSPSNTIDRVDAFVLSGGSAYGLDAGSGVAAGLRARGIGLPVYGTVVPIVPAAIILDLNAGGATDWTEPPWRGLGRAAIDAAAPGAFGIGTAGAGTGAVTANLKGGLGSASCVLEGGITVGAIAAANPIGSVTVGDAPQFWAAPFEIGDEFGGLGPAMAPAELIATKPEQRASTAIAVVATDLKLTKAQAHRMAVMAHDGIARAIVPSHTPFDGDLVFAASTGRIEVDAVDMALIRVGHAAATCLARAITRAVYEAVPADGDWKPTWRERFGSAPRP
ncbi:peptidase T4 [Rhodobacterales bacterium HKCCE3408]|nr:peptidase T4 [Rhodobacterales bacterium HKCCE3408]